MQFNELQVCLLFVPVSFLKNVQLPSFAYLVGGENPGVIIGAFETWLILGQLWMDEDSIRAIVSELNDWLLKNNHAFFTIVSCSYSLMSHIKAEKNVKHCDFST